jgi:hypothetical protein
MKDEQALKEITNAEGLLRSERAVEMLFHAYCYVRESDLGRRTCAASLLWSRYRELKRKDHAAEYEMPVNTTTKRQRPQ